MALVQTGFEVSPTGTTIPTTGANGGNAFTATGVTGTGATFTSDSSVPAAIAEGSFCAKLSSPATAQVNWRGWTLASPTVSSGRMYLYLTALPPSTMTLVAAFQGGTQRARLLLTATGTLQHHNGTTFSGTSGTAVPLNTLMRVEWKWDIGVGTFIADLYTGHSTTALSGGIGLTAQSFGSATAFDEMRLGMSAAQVANYTYYTDAWAVSDSTTRPGPVAAGPGQGSAAGSFAFAGAAAGREPAGGAAAGAWAFAGAATGGKPVYPLAETVATTFDTSSGWTLTTGATVTGGELVITPTSLYPRATKDGKYNILGSFFGGRLTQRAVGSAGNTTLLRVAIDATNTIELSVSQTGGVGAITQINGDSTSAGRSFFPGLISNATHYRIKVAADRTISWLAMVGGVWFTVRTGVTAPAGWDLSQVQLVIMAGLTDPATNTQPAKWTSAGIYNDVTPTLTNTSVDFGVAPTTVSSPPLTSEIDAYQGLVGRKPHMELWYRAWVNTITSAQLEQVRARGNVSMLTWEAWDWGPTNASTTYNLANITRGDFDAYITATATTMKNWGGLIYLRPLHEFNHTAYPWCVTVNGNTPADFIPAWKHIVDIFRAVGTPNVKWVWSPNQTNGVTPLSQVYPGDAYVDLIALDAYNFGGADSYTWPANVFDGSFAEIRSVTTTKPLWIGETASSPTGGDKAQWVTEFFNWIRLSTNSDVKGFNWFDVNKENDWTVNSTPAVQSAFTAGLATLDPPPPGGTASGTFGFTGTASGKRAPKATGSGSWSFTGAAAGKRTPKSSATGSWSFTGAASGKEFPKGTATGGWSFAGAAVGREPAGGAGSGTFVLTGAAAGTAPTMAGFGNSLFGTAPFGGPAPLMQGVATGTFTFTGAATGRRIPQAAATGAFTFAGTAVGKRAPKASTTGTFTLTGAAVGSSVRWGAATGTWTNVGAAAGTTARRGTGSGLLAFTGAAAGTAPTAAGFGNSPFGSAPFGGPAPLMQGAATGSWAFTGTATGARAPRGTGLGAWAYAGSAAGAVTRRGTATDTWAFTGAAIGQTARRGTGSGLLAWLGSAIGARPVVGGKSGAGLGAWSYTGAATGTRAARGTATGTWTHTGTATGVSVRSGTGTGLLTWAGVATGVQPVVGGKSGTASGSWNFTSAASGYVSRRGAATGAVAYTGTATGTKPTLNARTGTASGTSTWTGTAIGRKTAAGAAVGAITITGTATGTTRRTGTGTGGWAYAGFATSYQGPARDITVVFGNPRRATLTVGSRE